VPGHDTAGLDGEATHAEDATVDAVLLRHVERGDNRVGLAHRGHVDRRARVGFLLIGGTFPGESGRGHHARTQHNAGK